MAVKMIKTKKIKKIDNDLQCTYCGDIINNETWIWWKYRQIPNPLYENFLIMVNTDNAL